MEFLKNICWQGFAFGSLIVATAIITGPHKETNKPPKKGYQLLWIGLIVLGLVNIILSLIPNLF